MKVKVNIDKKLDEIFIDIYTPSEDEKLKSILDNLRMKKPVLNGYMEEKTYLLNINDIYSIYAENKKVYAHTKDRIYRVKYRLYELEEILDKNRFVRISNSAIINIYKIENLEATINGMITINFKNGKKEYISRRYLKKVKKILDI
ncbi:LytTR family DNA-binding domain-containing protein [Clostridium thermobutyricum]